MSIREIKIEPLSNDEDILKKIVKLHKQLFDKEHFTSTFSEDLLKKYFSDLVKSSPFKYLAIAENELVGYLIGGVNLNYALSEFSKKHFLKLVLLLLRNPEFIKEKIQDIFRKIFLTTQKSSIEMRLFLIAAKHNEQTKGIGRKLIQKFEQDLIQNKVHAYGLSVRRHNNKAIDFYYKLGFVEEFRTNKSIYFIKRLKSI